MRHQYTDTRAQENSPLPIERRCTYTTPQLHFTRLPNDNSPESADRAIFQGEIVRQGFIERQRDSLGYSTLLPLGLSSQ